MGWVGKYWKVLLAILMLIAAAAVLFLVYKPKRLQYEVESASLDMMNTALESQLQVQLSENAELEKIKDVVGPAREAIDKSMEELKADRSALYDNFPGGILEEDQILYVMDLEDILDMEVMFGRMYDSLSDRSTRDTVFEFVPPQDLWMLTDYSMLKYVSVKIDFDMPYEAFKEMLAYLANDERITSINYSKIDYDQINNRVVGFAYLQYFYLESEAVPYEAQEIDGQDIGKTTIFE